ncbi:hypothetical protein J6590_041583 [Homalodisca vitripennis]|nr:hypothetical protein J6590_041583 [Homalodisca vitripennis]
MQQPRSAEISGQLCCRLRRNCVVAGSELEDSEFEESEKSVVIERCTRDINCESDSSDEDIFDGDIHPENSLQGSHLGTLLFSIFVNEIKKVTKVPFLLFADDIKLFLEVSSSAD